ncbi:MAG: hypothetical protein KDI90_06495 [Alphaproteobacteria bacterium]|nr:hypothetical protein [Alphaproteobacteria bacterium]MCB9975056.1 hypothetical protein [Rhodospirillales bacterium]
MFNKTKLSYYKLGAAMTAGVIATSASTSAYANNNFSNIAQNITTSIQSIPGLLTALAYLFGILLGVLGVLKIKDHVENPTQTPLKDGAIRLAAGGALFALPILFQAMNETLDSAGNGGTSASASQMFSVSFNVT